MDSKLYLPVLQAAKFAAVVFLLYVCTLAPDLVWQDQGDYQYQAAKLVLNIPGDAVRVHPLYVVVSHVLGKITPMSWAYASNLVSAVCGALTGFFLFLIIALLAESVFAAFLGAGVYCLAHTPWFIGVQAQTYSMAMALMTGGILAALIYSRRPLRKYLVAMGLAFGLGISTHLMSQIAFAVIMCWLFCRFCRGKERFVNLLIVGICWAAGAVLLWIVMAIEYDKTGDFAGTIASAIWGRWGSAVFNMERFVFLTKQSVKFFVLNFPTPLVLLVIPGLVYASRRLDRAVSAVLLVMTVLYAIFAVRYDVPNQNHFFLPMYALFCIYIGLGYKYLEGRMPRLAIICTAMLLLIPAMYPVMAHVAKAKNISLGTKRHIPYRDVYKYYLEPWQQDQFGPRRLVQETLAKLPPRSIIYVDSTIISAFEYAIYVENQRQDVMLMPLSKSPVWDIEGARLFTICNEKGYRPAWTAPDQLNQFPISDQENIYEILPN
jgi:hypothetical protein